jgi:osmoprotectant transport system substrate-binding protein
VVQGRGLVALLPTGAGEKPVVVVRTVTSVTAKVTKVEELWRISRKATLGGPPGCENSLECALGMRREFGIRWDKVRSFADAQRTLDALRAGDIEAAVLDRTLVLGSDMTRLTGDEALLGIHPLVPIVRAQRLDADDRAEVDRVSAALDADGYATLVANAHKKGAKQLAVIDEWLTSHGWDPIRK